MKIITHSEEETVLAAEKWAEKLQIGDAVLYTGEMGAGKTRFTKGIARRFGIDGGVCSPTFALVNEYTGGSADVFHFDLFRVDNYDDLYATGFFDYLNRGGIIAVEWSENIPGLAEEFERAWLVDIRKMGENDREITILRYGGPENEDTGD